MSNVIVIDEEAAEAAVEALPVPMGSAEVADLKAATLPMLEQARALVIDSPETDAYAKELLAQVSKSVKRVEALRKRWTKPILDHKRSIDADFNRISEPAKSAERILREKVAQYHVEQQRRAREAAKAAAEAAGLSVVAAPAAKVATDAGTVSMRQTWDFVILDASQVPEQYKVVDPAKVRAAVKAGVRNIPGVDIFESATAVVR